MAAIVIPIVTNWSVTPQNGQEDYFIKMNTWLSESTSVIASLNTAIVKINESNTQSNSNLAEVIEARDITVQAKDEAVTAIATLTAGAIDDTTIAPNKAFSNSHIEANYYDKDEVYNKTEINNNFVDKTTDQEIDSIKTFIKSPIVPTPTSGTQAVNKDYADSTNNILQVVYAENKVVGSGSLTIPIDGTIPQITEGNEILTCTITPKKENSRLLIEFTPSCQEVSNTGNTLAVACFRNGVSDALYVTATVLSYNTLSENSICGRFMINTPTTSPITFSLRAGLKTGSIRWNQIKHPSESETMNTSTTMTITEIAQ